MANFEYFLYVAMAVLVLSIFLCLWRITHGPTAPDRMVGIDILGVSLVNFSVLIAMLSGRGYYMTLALAWALLAFIATVGLSKYLEGRGLDE